ncbi:MAG: LCP family protein [Propionibacteriaceae bacterium]|nr:LCP family protein [Propionibacteriaceae bacterium]
MDDNNSGAFGDQTPDAVVDDPAENRLQPVKRTRRPSIASIIISLVLVACAVTGVVILGTTHVVPARMMIPAVITDFVLVAVAVVLLLISRPRRHPVRFWLSTILALVLAIANVGVAKVGSDYLKVTSEIQPPASDTVLYDVVVLTSGPTDVSQLAGTTMGEVANDPLSDAVHSHLTSLVNVSFQSSATWTALVAALTGSDVTSIVIEDPFMQILSDADPDTYGTLRILTSFEIDSSLANTPPSPSPSPTTTMTNPDGAYIIYVSGIDTYGSISTRSRSDVNILVVVNPKTGKVLLVNTPRDFYVQLRGTTGLKDKLTHSGVYGINVSVGTMEDLYGINIDYYLRINFSSLVTIIDALGGVDVNSAYNFSYGGYTFTQGMNHLNGAAALAFSRDRHDFALGDRIRGENQERVIEGVINKLSNPSVLVGYTRILSSIQNSIQTSMPQDVISEQVRQQLSTGQSWSTTSISVTGGDGSEYTYSYPTQKLYVMIPDQSTVDAAKQQIQATLTGQ